MVTKQPLTSPTYIIPHDWLWQGRVSKGGSPTLLREAEEDSGSVSSCGK